MKLYLYTTVRYSQKLLPAMETNYFREVLLTIRTGRFKDTKVRKQFEVESLMKRNQLRRFGLLVRTKNHQTKVMWETGTMPRRQRDRTDKTWDTAVPENPTELKINIERWEGKGR